MKKPWVVGLLSIVPGLGLIVLGQIVAGLGIMAGMSLLVFLFLITTPANLSAWFFSFALILWMLQLGYAVLATKVAASNVSPKKIAQRKAAAVQGSAKEALTPLLLPGQHLRIALDGMGGIDVRLVGGMLLALLNALGGGAYISAPSRPTTWIGITENELVFATTRRIPKPSNLRRVPLADVSLVKFKESRWGDKLVLHIGKRKLLRLYTTKSLRPAIRELAALLYK